ncbi:hypothetical protein EVAR_95965_1 [Eumeta japonica]|uniref:Uncharacterized protein n=1 Tax=Eumeta variegata TaxID=151549 RepID=A0A4C1V8H6_EUMVA|nr:hypothetical protein EVAR_95965_1 [Eumeta japonica]
MPKKTHCGENDKKGVGGGDEQIKDRFAHKSYSYPKGQQRTDDSSGIVSVHGWRCIPMLCSSRSILANAYKRLSATQLQYVSAKPNMRAHDHKAKFFVRAVPSGYVRSGPCLPLYRPWYILRRTGPRLLNLQ